MHSEIFTFSFVFEKSSRVSFSLFLMETDNWVPVDNMRTQLAPLIVVKQEFPDFRTSLLNGVGNNDEENNNEFPIIKSENDCNNNQPEDLNSFLKKSKKQSKKL